MGLLHLRFRAKLSNLSKKVSRGINNGTSLLHEASVKFTSNYQMSNPDLILMDSRRSMCLNSPYNIC